MHFLHILGFHVYDDSEKRPGFKKAIRGVSYYDFARNVVGTLTQKDITEGYNKTFVFTNGMLLQPYFSLGRTPSEVFEMWDAPMRKYPLYKEGEQMSLTKEIVALARVNMSDAYDSYSVGLIGFDRYRGVAKFYTFDEVDEGFNFKIREEAQYMKKYIRETDPDFVMPTVTIHNAMQGNFNVNRRWSEFPFFAPYTGDNK